MLSLLLLSLSIIALIDVGEAYNVKFNEYVQWGKILYIDNPSYPRDYLPGSNYEYTIKANGNFKLFCDIYIGWPDALIIKQSSAGRDLIFYGKDKFTVISKNNIIMMAIDSSWKSTGGRFHCKAERLGSKNNQCSCGWRNIKMETKAYEFPMMTGLININDVKRGYKNVICGATIINPRQVITSALCFEKQTVSNVRVMIGSHNLDVEHEPREIQMLNIKHVRKHPGYNPENNYHDIAIVDVQGDIEFSHNVSPVCLPFSRQEQHFYSNKAMILGWTMNGFMQPKSKILRRADVSIISTWECLKYYPKLNFEQMCTLDDSYDSCGYGRGGPLLWYNTKVKRLFLVGIVSNSGRCDKQQPTLHTNIYSYLEWIEKNKLNEFEYCRP